MKYRLPIVLEQAVRGAEAARTVQVNVFEAGLQESTANRHPATCQKGCHHCCYYPRMVSVLEGVTLFRWLVEHGLWRKSLQEKLQAAHRSVWGLSPSVWMLSMVPCPLLTDEGLCGAYDGRPFLCRTTASTGDPHYCHPHRFTDGMAGLVPRKAVDTAVQEAENRLLKGAKLTLLRLPLATAILMGEKLCKEGLAPEEIHETLFEDWARSC